MRLIRWPGLVEGNASNVHYNHVDLPTFRRHACHYNDDDDAADVDAVDGDYGDYDDFHRYYDFDVMVDETFVQFL